MTGWPSGRALAAGTLALALSSVGTAHAAGAARTSSEVEHTVLFELADADIRESSGLVDDGAVVHTVNDSGSGPELYTVDAVTGETLEVTTYTSDDVEDVEALAPGARGVVWVGDIGDNLKRRDSVAVYRVRPGSGAAPRTVLTYPDGPRDAETLLVHPRTGRMFVVSKTVFGGVVYEVPGASPSGTAVMRRFAQVPGLVTDGAFFPDGRHVVLRGYGTASVYTFPGFALRGTVTLPPQQQGEGISVGPDGRVLLSSEGEHAPVLQVELPDALVDPSTPTDPSPRSPASRPSPGPVTSADGDPTGAGSNPLIDAVESVPGPWWAAGALVGLGVLVARGRRRP